MIYIITFHGSLNYGAVMQGLGLCRAIAGRGFDYRVIDYNRRRHHRSYILPGFSGASFKGKLYILSQALRKRRLSSKFNSFICKNERLTAAYDGREALKHRTWDANDTYITGSDQVFNTDVTLRDFSYYLDFTDSENKFAYAPSFGKVSLAEADCGICAELLSKYAVLTCREESGAQIIDDLTGKKPPVVLDPSFLPSADEWSALERKPRTDGYALLFLLGHDASLEAAAVSYAQAQGVALINIAYSVTVGGGARNVKNVSPAEWLGYIHGADRVFTNSYHGMVFSLIFRRQFSVGLDRRDGQSRNTRITDLLARIGADAVLSDIDTVTDYSTVGPRLEAERRFSCDVLDGILASARKAEERKKRQDT